MKASTPGRTVMRGPPRSEAAAKAPEPPAPLPPSLSGAAAAIDALLPQTQCTRCGFSGCGPYARAVAAGEAQTNRCPPGGKITVHRLADLLKVAPEALDPSCGTQGPWRVAAIVEHWCIGCTRCIQVCPVDAIVGAAKQMHTVITHECTGCELCLPACPVDCIELVPMPGAQAPGFLDRWLRSGAALARRRYRDRLHRLAKREGREGVGQNPDRKAAPASSEVHRGARDPSHQGEPIEPDSGEPDSGEPDSGPRGYPALGERQTVVREALERARRRGHGLNGNGGDTGGC